MLSASTDVRVPTRPVRYCSAFTQWDKRAWVRTAPRRDDSFQPGFAFFPPALTPLHRAAAKRGRCTPELQQQLAVHQLLAHLSFTVRIEVEVVNRAASLLHRNDLGLLLPDDARRDALRVYTDEGGHAEMCHSFIASVARATGIRPIEHEPAFIGRLERLRRAHAAVTPELFTLFAAVVSELLITPTLSSVPKDEAVQLSVRLLLRDHALDERRHFAFFRSVFGLVWPRLSSDDRHAVALLLPDIVRAFLDPDVPLCLQVMLQSEERPEVAEAAVAALLADDATEGDRRSSSIHVLRLLDEHGVFTDDTVQKAFAGAGLA